MAAVFWAFRVMVGLGMLMIATGLAGLVLHLKKRLFDTPWFYYLCMAMTPAGFVSVLSGWFVTEIGRQPYVVYEVYEKHLTLYPRLSVHPLPYFPVCYYSHLYSDFWGRQLLHHQTHFQRAGYSRRCLWQSRC